MPSRLYNLKGGKKKFLSRSYLSPRQHANTLRVGVGSSKRGAWRTSTVTETKKWKPRTGRRKAGARRKVTLIKQLWQWIKVPTKVQRRTPRRRRR